MTNTCNVAPVVTSGEIEPGLDATATAGEPVKTGQNTAPVKNGVGKASGIARPTITVTDFMSLVVPWPINGTGHVNLHYSMPNQNGGNDFVTGRPFSDIDQFITYTRWALTKSNFKEMWYCTSLQSQSGTTQAGKPKAIRLGANALSLRAIWIDIDVKDDPKHYKSLDEAWEAFVAFRKATNLPRPSAVVKSGGGMHIYWISDKPLLPDEWAPYANGLKTLLLKREVKCDAGLTTDNVRLLRVPGTFNFKYDPPRPVELLPIPMVEYDFLQALKFLADIAPVTAAVKSGFELPEAFMGKKAAWTGEGKLSDGISKYDDMPPLKVEPIAKGCAFIREALETGGKDYTQPLWNLTTLAATFMENGHELAHRMGRDHLEYTRETTDALWARKNRERADRGLGWPSCKAIQADGCVACAMCPHFGKIKSPLNLGAGTRRWNEVSSGGSDQEITNPAARLKQLFDQGANLAALCEEMNKYYAVVRYGDKILVVCIGKSLRFMIDQEFHKMFANIEFPGPRRPVKASRFWFSSPNRRQYLGRGAVFEPGGPAEVPGDMINIYRGFGITPAPGKWALMHEHIVKVLCSGQQDLSEYLIKWMAWAVQNLDKPIGVAIALLGEQGAGKGVFARMFGSFFGEHFSHIANGEQLTGRFNAAIGTSCMVFLDEALWAGDKKGEGVLKALITEPSLSLEAKFKDPIKVDNRLRIIIASNNDWAVPAGAGDRRWCVLEVNNCFAGMGNADYFNPLYAEITNGGAAAMLYDLLNLDLRNFDVHAIPRTAAKANQQVLSLQSTAAWIYHILHEGMIGDEGWKSNGLTIDKDIAYAAYEDFSKRRRDYRPDGRPQLSKKLIEALGTCLKQTRPTIEGERPRLLQFAPLADCRRQFGKAIKADFEWELEIELDTLSAAQTATDKTPEQVGSTATPLQPDCGEAEVGQSNKPDPAPNEDGAPETDSAPRWRETL